MDRTGQKPLGAGKHAPCKSPWGLTRVRVVQRVRDGNKVPSDERVQLVRENRISSRFSLLRATCVEPRIAGFIRGGERIGATTLLWNDRNNAVEATDD